MCQTNSLEMVSQSAYGYIAYCAGCERYNLIFENIFVLLKEQELRGLGAIIDQEYGIWVMNSPIGRGKEISMQTPIPNTYFAFTYCEYEEFKRMVNEAILLLEATSLIQVKK